MITIRSNRTSWTELSGNILTQIKSSGNYSFNREFKGRYTIPSVNNFGNEFTIENAIHDSGNQSQPIKIVFRRDANNDCVVVSYSYGTENSRQIDTIEFETHTE